MDYVQRKNDPFDTGCYRHIIYQTLSEGMHVQRLKQKHLNNILKKVLSVFKVCSKDTQPN